MNPLPDVEGVFWRDGRGTVLIVFPQNFFLVKVWPLAERP